MGSPRPRVEGALIVLGLMAILWIGHQLWSDWFRKGPPPLSTYDVLRFSISISDWAEDEARQESRRSGTERAMMCSEFACLSDGMERWRAWLETGHPGPGQLRMRPSVGEDAALLAWQLSQDTDAAEAYKTLLHVKYPHWKE